MRISDWSSDVCSSDLLIAQHRVYRSRQKWPDCHRRDDSNDQTGEDQYLDRKTHPRGRLRWLAGQIDGRWSEEGLMDEAQRIEHAECARESRDIRQGGIDDCAAMLAECLGKEHFLGEEAIDRKSTRLNSSH